MTFRASWRFPYTADKLLKAATDKKGFHETRKAWWETKRDEIKADIREKGLEIDESIAHGSPKFSASNYRDPIVQINNEMLRDLQETLEKVREHGDKVKDYDAWCQVLASQGQVTFDLNHQDWLFFFGK